MQPVDSNTEDNFTNSKFDVYLIVKKETGRTFVVIHCPLQNVTKKNITIKYHFGLNQKSLACTET